MTYKHSPLPLLTILFIFIFQACGPSGTVTVVEDAPRTETAEEEADTLATEYEFKQLTLGMIDPVTNLDPLFADNLSTLRVISLIYEGLYKLDPQGEPVPALARETEVSDDGLEYLVSVNRENTFHDNEIFSSGLGRRIHAEDIKWAFERTAKVDVPEPASQLLMNIKGYENYYLEQRTLYDEEKRVLDEVEGIEVIDSNTIRFELEEEDPDFLHKLASPYLAVYPRETLQNSDGLRSNPVGTGPYTFRERIDNQWVLIHKDAGEEEVINRINVAFFEEERELFQEFIRNEIDWIPEAGTRTNDQVINEDGIISSSYEEEFQLTEHEGFRITSMYINPDSDSGLNWFVNQLNDISEEDFSIRGEYHFQEQEVPETEGAEPESDTTYYISYTDNRVARSLLNELQDAAIQPEASLAFYDIRIPTPSTILFCRHSDSFHNEWNPLPSDYWLQLNTKIISLYHSHLSGIEPSAVPWLLQIEDVRINGPVN